jgi:arginase
MNAHGMPVAALLGLCKSGINDIATTHLKKQNVFWVGARDLDPGEKELLAEIGINDNVYTTEQIHRMGMSVVMADIRQKMEKLNVPALHLSFDIDGMDNLLAPATGVPEPNGLTENEFNLFCDALQDIPQQFTSIDFVEYSPLLDTDDFQTGKRCVNGLSQLIASVH